MCSIPCRVSCFASVDLKEKDEFNHFFQIDRGKTASAARRRDDLCLVFLFHPFFHSSSMVKAHKQAKVLKPTVGCREWAKYELFSGKSVSPFYMQ